jgi:hypothetical protein
MAIIELPTRVDISVYDFTIELDAETFTVALTYSPRSAHWYMSISDLDGVPLRQGIKLVSNWPLLMTWVQQGRPDGEMICANPETDDDPDRETLGTDSVFVYDEGGAIGG